MLNWHSYIRNASIMNRNWDKMLHYIQIIIPCLFIHLIQEKYNEFWNRRQKQHCTAFMRVRQREYGEYDMNINVYLSQMHSTYVSVQIAGPVWFERTVFAFEWPFFATFESLMLGKAAVVTIGTSTQANERLCRSYDWFSFQPSHLKWQFPWWTTMSFGIWNREIR